MGGIIKVTALIKVHNIPINKACVFHQTALTGRHRSEELLNIFIFVLLDFVAVKLFFNWLEQSMARSIYIIIHSAANFIVN
jgi:hypothetical protein